MALLLPVTRVVIPRFGTAGLLTAPAAVPIMDAQGNPAGYGPSNSPGGIFFGMSPFPYTLGDVWWPSSVPAGLAITPMAGGSYQVSATIATPPGNWPWTWTVQDVFGNRTTGIAVVTVT